MIEGCERGKLGDQEVHSIRATVFNRRKETLPMKATNLIIRKLYIGYRYFIRYPPNSLALLVLTFGEPIIYLEFQVS